MRAYCGDIYFACLEAQALAKKQFSETVQSQICGSLNGVVIDLSYLADE